VTWWISAPDRRDFDRVTVSEIRLWRAERPSSIPSASIEQVAGAVRMVDADMTMASLRDLPEFGSERVDQWAEALNAEWI
jgi:hypothetical protein